MIGDPGPSGDPGTPPAPASARRLVERLVRRAWEDDVLGESASAAFWQTLSLPPLLLGLFGMLGWVGDWFGPDTVVAVQRWIIDTTGGVFSRNAVDEIIAPTVEQILTRARGEVVSVGFLLSFWSGSTAMSAFVDAITKAHDQYPVRGFVRQRALAILLYAVGLAVGIVLLPVAALGPTRLVGLLPDNLEPAARGLFDLVYYPTVVLGLVLALTTLYKIALPIKTPWYRGLPGALLAAVVFLVGATGLRLYLDWITSTGYTYGALAAPIAFLLGTYFIALSLILGAHLNAAVQALWPAPLRRRGRLVAPDRNEPRAEPTTESSAGPGGESRTEPSTEPRAEPSLGPTAEPTAGPDPESGAEPGPEPDRPEPDRPDSGAQAPADRRHG